jgi:hypothetical protein
MGGSSGLHRADILCNFNPPQTAWICSYGIFIRNIKLNQEKGKTAFQLNTSTGKPTTSTF